MDRGTTTRYAHDQPRVAALPGGFIMGFGQAIKSAFGNYATFSGRARRSEFWLFYLFVQLLSVVGAALMLITALSVLPMSEGAGDPSGAGLAVFFLAMTVVVLAMVAVTIPMYAAWARRLHDMGQSGHWLWLNFVSLGIVPLIMAVMDSQPGTNRWGPDPKSAVRGQYDAYGQAPLGSPGYAPPQ
ncbi:MAG: DUF805 domain-containing protein [Demequina sp.]